MKNHHNIGIYDFTQIKNDAEVPAAPVGIFHLSWKGQWMTEFVSNSCFKILDCKDRDFLSVLTSAYPLSPESDSQESICDILLSRLQTPGSFSFEGLLWSDRESLPHIAGFLTIVVAQELTAVYGQLSDISEFREREETFQYIREEYNAGLHMSKRSLYHYLIDGRCAVIPSEISRKVGIPEIIPNLPEYNVTAGRISPKSVDDWYGVFAAIDRGETEGCANILFCLHTGEERWVSVQFYSIYDSQGKPYSAVISHRDINDEYVVGQQTYMDKEGLLQAARLFFPEIVSMNLTKGTYRILQYYQATSLGTPQEGTLENMLTLRLENVASEDQQAFKEKFFKEGLMSAITQGKEMVQLTYRRTGQDGTWHWMESTAIRQNNPYNSDILVLAVSRSVDKEKQDQEVLQQALTAAYEYELGEQIRQNMEARLAQNQQIFHIVAQHSDRTLCYYDLKQRIFKPWNTSDEENGSADFPHLFQHSYSDEQVNNDHYILPESMKDVKKMFANIHAGVPSGEANIHINMPDGQQRWYHFEYSCLYDDATPITALISYEDITQEHERDISYLRFLQSVGEKVDTHFCYIEANLTLDQVEKQISSENCKFKFNHGSSYTSYCNNYFKDFILENSISACQLCSRDTLLDKYNEGIHTMEQTYRFDYDGIVTLWMLMKTELLADPFTGHIKVFIQISDVTDEHEERIAVNMQANYDAMTKLLRRGVGEERIRSYLSSQNKAGILIILDLDDLKTLNDTLGHAYGDEAIIGISDTLRNHFRKDDILIRAGGDEFMVFLPGAAESVNSVALSMKSLLKKLSGIAIGPNKERYIHCSAGCAVQSNDITNFADLYHHADLALYHVKRNGKNNFAFYTPEMLQEDYQFRMDLAAPKAKNSLEKEEVDQILDMFSLYFQGMVFFNLTQNQYRILEVANTTGPIPLSGNIDTFWKITLEKIHPDDRERTFTCLSRDALLLAYRNGKPRVVENFLYQEYNEGYSPAHAEINFYINQSGDITAYALFRGNTHTASNLEILKLQKILELSGRTNFEYICLINIMDGSYSTYSMDRSNSHAIPETADFNAVTKYIRDSRISPEDKDTYYNNAALENVLKHMESQDYYSYQYSLKDGLREASFTWYENTHSELLMMVKKL